MKKIYDNNRPCNSVLVYERNYRKFRSHCDDEMCPHIEVNKFVSIKRQNLHCLDSRLLHGCELENQSVTKAFKKYVKDIH